MKKDYSKNNFSNSCRIIFPYKIEQWNEKSHLWFFYNCYPSYEFALSSYNILKSENKSIYRIIKVLDISRK